MTDTGDSQAAERLLGALRGTAEMLFACGASESRIRELFPDHPEIADSMIRMVIDRQCEELVPGIQGDDATAWLRRMAAFLGADL